MFNVMISVEMAIHLGFLVLAVVATMSLSRIASELRKANEK